MGHALASVPSFRSLVKPSQRTSREPRGSGCGQDRGPLTIEEVSRLLAETPSPARDLTPLLRPGIIPCVTIQAWNRNSSLPDFLPEQGAAPPQHPFLQGVTGDVDATGLRLLRLVKTTANLYETVVSQALSAKGLSGPRWHLLIRLW